MDESVNRMEEVLYDPTTMDIKAMELERDFSYEGYSVVRRELFAHLRDPSVTIRYNSVNFNNACVKALEDAEYIQILINEESRKMLIRKCGEDDKDALHWCIRKEVGRRPRMLKNPLFSPMLYEKMGWSANCRYKLLGYKIHYNDEVLFIFDLAETEIFLEKKALASIVLDDGTKTERPLTREELKSIRKPYYPEGWKDSFGLPVEDHEKALSVEFLEGYAVFRTDGEKGKEDNDRNEE